MRLGNTKHIIFTMLFLFIAIIADAQTDRQFVRYGNRMFGKQQYDKAEIQYRKAVSKNPSNPQAIYNLGCALMMQNKDSAAIVQYQKAAKLEKNKIRLASVYHNIGVICQNHQMYGDAIKAYEQALRNNPKDNETRYNLEENAEQLINAAIQNEKMTQQRLKKAMQKPGSRKSSEKNW